MNIKIQCCGLVILLVVLYFYIYHRRVKLKTETAFFRFLLAGMACVCLDILSIYAICNSDSVGEVWREIVCKAYIASVVLTIYSALMYVSVDIYKNKDTYKRATIIFGIGFVIVAICIGALPIKYYYEPASGVVYTEGPSVLIGYALGFIFLLALIFHIVFKHKELNLRRRNAMTVWLVIWVCAVLIQFFNNELLFISFAGALGIVIVYLLLENPETNIDKETGVFNQNALVQYVRERFNEYESFSALELIVDKGMENVSVELCTFLLTIPETVVFRYSSNAVMLLFEETGRTIRFKDMITARLEQGLGKNNNIFLKPYWYYVADSGIVDSSEDFFSLLGYAHQKSVDKVSSDITYIDGDIAYEMYRSFEIEGLLEEAINNDKVEVYYQPIYSAKERRFMSAEALVRIRDEKGNIIYPGAFINIAENNGMILKLGEIVFNKVCRFISETSLEELGIDYIEVNLSVIQCAHRSLAADYMSIMNRYGINPAMINLEITETASAGTKKILLENMAILRDFGVSFSLDDFGTGQSNLNYIAEMPVDIVKFDKQMVQSYFTSRKAKYVMNAAINMARGMELEIVFEGIETREQYQEAERIGIDYIQGYYFSMPLPEAEFCRFLRCRQ